MAAVGCRGGERVVDNLQHRCNCDSWWLCRDQPTNQPTNQPTLISHPLTPLLSPFTQTHTNPAGKRQKEGSCRAQAESWSRQAWPAAGGAQGSGL